MRRILFCFALVSSTLIVSGQRGTPARVESGQKGSEDFIFDIQPRVITVGQAAVLHWYVKGATRVVIKEEADSENKLSELGAFGPEGSLEVRPRESTTYVINCEGSATFFCASVSIHVRANQR